MEENILNIQSRKEFREWLSKHSKTEKECWLFLKRGKPDNDHQFFYIDAVEEALCFGWIDSTNKKINGITMQRFSKRGKNTVWSELNRERVRRLESLGLMTEEGRAVLPDLSIENFTIHPTIEKALKEADAWEKFLLFPALYQRVRAYNVAFYMDKDKDTYAKALNHLIEMTRQSKMYGQWNDYGRLFNENNE